MKRIVYIQYTNPAAYPPLIHSSAILADRGWEILFLSIAARGAESLALPANQHIRVKQLGAQSGGPLGSIKYASFVMEALQLGKQFRADWCYASDPLSAPVGLVCKKLLRMRVLYHEHDVPALRAGPREDAILFARDRVARAADVVVAPAAARLALLPEGRGQRFVVWNCPAKSEVAPDALPVRDGNFRVVYHGSLSRERLTPQFIDALALLPAFVELHVFGYETQGHRGYTAELAERARSAGVATRFFHHGVIPERTALLQRLRDYDLGIATVTTDSADQNLRLLAGASNKPFEYLSAGLPLLVSSKQEWLDLYVRPGYAISCEPTDPASIAAAIVSLARDRERARAMGASGTQRVLAEWNYETQFAPVLSALEH